MGSEGPGAHSQTQERALAGQGCSPHSRRHSQALTPVAKAAWTRQCWEPQAAHLSDGQEVAGDRAALDSSKTFFSSLQP